MIVIRYALVLRDDHDSRIAAIGTGREPMTKHGKVTPNFHTFCLSVFALYASAVSIETVSWRAGVDIERASVLLVARRTERVGSLAYSFAGMEEQHGGGSVEV